MLNLNIVNEKMEFGEGKKQHFICVERNVEIFETYIKGGIILKPRLYIFNQNLSKSMSWPRPYYNIKADPKSNIVGLRIMDILCCFVKFGWPKGYQI